jgi:hypothetical protein
MAVIKSTFIDGDGTAVTRTRELAQVASSGVNYSLVSGNLVKTYFEQDTDLACWRIVETRPFFPQLRSSISIRNLIPPEFLGLIPQFQRSEFVPGIVNDPPTLVGDELAVEEEQTDTVKKRVTTTNLGAPSLPITYQNQVLGGDQYGGEVLKRILTLNDVNMTVDQGIGVVSSEVKRLGPTLYIKMTEEWDTATAWPTLFGTEVDPKYGVVVGVTKKVVAAGTLGGIIAGAYTDVKPLDKWRSITIASKLDPSTLPAPVSWETVEEFTFPNVLLAARFIWAYASTDSNYDFDAALLVDMVHGSVGPKRAKITESFTLGPPTDSVAATVFQPQAHLVGFAWWYANATSGVAKAQARTFSIPPSIHGPIDLGIAVNVATGGSTLIVVSGCHVTLGSFDVTTSSAGFTSGMLGQPITGVGFIPAGTVISSFIDTGHVKISQAAIASGSNLFLSVGTGQTVQTTETLPATNPAGLPPSGDLITIEARVERWRFGVFMRHLVQLFVP